MRCMVLDCTLLGVPDGTVGKEDMPKHCLPFRDVSGDLIESCVEIINGEASFNN
jgi:hypothetical protein